MRIGIVGTGTMGAGIAQVAALAGHDVFIYDAQAEAGQQALLRIDQNLRKEIEKGRLSSSVLATTLQHLCKVDQLDKLSACDWII